MKQFKVTYTRHGLPGDSGSTGSITKTARIRARHSADAATIAVQSDARQFTRRYLATLPQAWSTQMLDRRRADAMAMFEEAVLEVHAAESSTPEREVPNPTADAIRVRAERVYRTLAETVAARRRGIDLSGVEQGLASQFHAYCAAWGIALGLDPDRDWTAIGQLEQTIRDVVNGVTDPDPRNDEEIRLDEAASPPRESIVAATRRPKDAQ